MPPFPLSRICFTDCRNTYSHKKLEHDEADSFCKFMRSVRNKRDDFLNGKNPRKNKGNQKTMRLTAREQALR